MIGCGNHGERCYCDLGHLPSFPTLAVAPTPEGSPCAWSGADLAANLAVDQDWVHGLSKTEYSRDVLIIAGDVADTLRGVKAGLGALKAKFGRVFYTPGNHVS